MRLFHGNCRILISVVGVFLICPSIFGVEAEIHRYEIPSGPAEETLIIATEQGRLELVYTSDIVVGIQTNSIGGQFSAMEALDRMLEGTPLVAVPVSEGTAFGIVKREEEGFEPQLTLETTQNTEPQIQEETEMNAQKNNWFKTLAAVLTLGIAGGNAYLAAQEDDDVYELKPFEVSDGSSLGYGSLHSQSSGRLNQPYLDIPQTVSVVTAEFMEDSLAFDSREALKFVNNVVPLQNNHGASFLIRGFSTGRQHLDGFQSVGGQQFDVFFADRIEIVRGPSSFAIGSGNPAGFINYVSKRPNYIDAGELSFMVDSESSYRVNIDKQGTIGEEGNAAYRIMAFHHDGSKTRDFHDFKRSGAQLAMGFKFKNGANLNLLGRYSDETNPSSMASVDTADPIMRRIYFETFGPHSPRRLGALGAGAIPDYPLIDPKRVIAFEDDRYESENFLLSAIYDQRVSDIFSMRHGIQYFDTSRHGQFTIGSALNGREVADTDPQEYETRVPVRNLETASQSLNYQSDLLFDYELGDTTQNTLIGWSYSDSDSGGGNRTLVAGFFDWYQWTGSQEGVDSRGNPLTIFEPGSALYNIAGRGNNTESSSHSVYAQHQAKFFDDRLQLSVGGRKVWSDSISFRRSDGSLSSDPPEEESDISPRYSALFKLTDTMSIYALKAEHSDPLVTRAAWRGLPSGDPREDLRISTATKSEIEEFGVKGQFYDGKVVAVLTHFEVSQNGVFVPQYFPGEAGVATNWITTDRVTNGWELEIFGQPTDKLTGIFAASFSDGEVPAQFAPYPIIEPPHLVDTISGLIRYDFSGDSGEGFSVRVGGKFWDEGWNARAELFQPYTRKQYIVDLGASYKWDEGKNEIDFKINNATDEFVVLHGNSNYDLRTTFLTYRRRF